MAADRIGVHRWLVGRHDSDVGRPLGKGPTGLRVISAAADQRPTLRQATRREALNAVGAIPFVGPILIAAFWITVAVTARRSPAGVGINDRFAPHTCVVRDGGAPSELTTRRDRPACVTPDFVALISFVG